MPDSRGHPLRVMHAGGQRFSLACLLKSESVVATLDGSEDCCLTIRSDFADAGYPFLPVVAWRVNVFQDVDFFPVDRHACG